jgi:hypothetical protein
VEHWASTYDLLFKVPIKTEYLHTDGTRSTDLAFQKAIDSTLNDLLEETGIPWVLFTSLEEAVERARLASGRLPIA